ncbi:MAG TPA: hypothetical protein VFV50_05025 [Bdellovibrionales bacterium]|nr:hypothetical protein [Bdellovibrionales bacterium]
MKLTQNALALSIIFAPVLASSSGASRSEAGAGTAREPSAYTADVDAKKDYQQRDRDYLDYRKKKQRLEQERQAGLEQYRYQKAYREWAAEKARRAYVRNRDAKDRQPASVLQARELQYEKDHAKYLAERERDRLNHIYRRDIREKAREDVEANPPNEAIRKRNERPWDE